MPSYFVSGVDTRSRRVTREVEASDTAAAVETLTREGFTEVQLESSEVGAAIQALFDPKTLASNKSTLSADARWKIQRDGRRGVLAVVRHALLPYVILAPTAAVGVLWLRHRRFAVVWAQDWTLLATAAVPLVLMLRILWRVQRAPQPYHRLLTALVWHRWPEVLEIVDQFEREGVGQAHTKLPAIETAGRRAQALAGLGRVTEAEAVLHPFANDPAVPKWMYWTRVGSLYSAANDDERVVACAESALACNPKSIELTISLAQNLLFVGQEHAERARALIDSVRAQASARARHAISMVDGLVALADARFDAALAHLDTAREQLASDLPRSPITDAGVLFLHAQSALALAGLGRADEASARLAVARPLLEAQQATKLLARIDSAIAACGHPASAAS